MVIARMDYHCVACGWTGRNPAQHAAPGHEVVPAGRGVVTQPVEVPLVCIDCGGASVTGSHVQEPDCGTHRVEPALLVFPDLPGLGFELDRRGAVVKAYCLACGHLFAPQRVLNSE